MKFYKTLFFALFMSQFVFANIDDITPRLSKRHHECHSKPCPFAVAGYGTMDPGLWYVINTQSYPNAIPLSLNRNHGFKKGHFKFTSTGFKVQESGHYSVNFTAILSNLESISAPFFAIFLVRDGIFNPEDNNAIAGVGSIPDGLIVQIQGTGILKHVKKGTKLSLVIANGGGMQPQPITVAGWSINATKICCDE